MDLKKLAGMIADSATTTQTFEPLLGAPSERLRRQVRFLPKSPDFDSASLEFDEEEGEIRLSALLLRAGEGANLSLADLRRIFGEDQWIFSSPGEGPNRRRWIFQPKGTKFGTMIVGTFSGAPEAESSRLTGLEFCRRSR